MAENWFTKPGFWEHFVTFPRKKSKTQNGLTGSGFRFRQKKKVFFFFFSLRISVQFNSKGRFGSGFGSWKTVPAVPVPLSVSGKTVPTVPVSGSGSVPQPPCQNWKADVPATLALFSRELRCDISHFQECIATPLRL